MGEYMTKGKSDSSAAEAIGQEASTALEYSIYGLLKKYHITMTTAESATGGMIASTLINVPGISAFFQEGYVTYSNEAKVKMIGVNPETIERYGVVSSETAFDMAESAARVAQTNAALSVTGVAGPDGGTEDKPVGLVYIACAGSKKTLVKECHFSGGRQSVRRQATEMVLQLLLTCIKELNC